MIRSALLAALLALALTACGKKEEAAPEAAAPEAAAPAAPAAAPEAAAPAEEKQRAETESLRDDLHVARRRIVELERLVPEQGALQIVTDLFTLAKIDMRLSSLFQTFRFSGRR